MENNVKRTDSYRIFKAAYEAVDAYYATKAKLRRAGSLFRVDGREYDLRNFDNIIVVGAGNATASMAKAVEDMLADKAIGGRINVKYGHTKKLERITQVEAGHPYSDENGVLGTRKIINLLEKAGENDLVINLISGGASALMSAPAAGITLEDKTATMKLLFEVGAKTDEMNAVRKHTSAIKGGRFVKYAYPAKVVSLILSDVIGDDLMSIGSGPTMPDTSTYLDAISVLKKYNIRHLVPKTIDNHLSKGLRGENLDAPKRGDKIYDKVQNVIVASIKKAIEKAKEEADFMNYKIYLLSDEIQGDVKEVAEDFSKIIRTKEFKKLPVRRPACILAGGKPTIRVRGKGGGGRNTELALLMAKELEGEDKIEFLSCSTDGSDGSTDAAGAIVDENTIKAAKKKKINADEYLGNSDSYTFFDKVGGLVKTGPTKTNVNDIQILLLK